jgi:glutathione synthase/RimK-type ligase-like ATP-grasp enzyme
MDNHPATPNHPPLIGIAGLARIAFAGNDLTPTGMALIARAGADSTDANALLDLATVFLLRANPEMALVHLANALALQQRYEIRASKPASLRLLAFMAPGDLMTNTALPMLLEGADIDLEMLYVAPHLPFPSSIPAHDVAFNAIGESEASHATLLQLQERLQAWPRPVLNQPQLIANTSREAAFELLGAIPGVVMPATVRATRNTLNLLARGDLTVPTIVHDADFPIIIRPVDSHAGRDLDKLDGPEDLAKYLAKTTDESFFLSRFIDYRNPDGAFRKYRIVLIGGRPFAVHMGISAHWMIHYLNAGMTESADKRLEEERWMLNFDEGFAKRHATALSAIAQAIGLDFLIIDCGETADGHLLLFEIDASAIIHAMDPVDVFPYKLPQMRKLFEGFRAMLLATVEARHSA